MHERSSARIEDLVFRPPDLFMLRYDLIDRAPGDEAKALKLLEKASIASATSEKDAVSSLSFSLITEVLSHG